MDIFTGRHYFDKFHPEPLLFDCLLSVISWTSIFFSILARARHILGSVMLAGGEPKIRVKNGLVTHGIEVELVFSFLKFFYISHIQ